MATGLLIHEPASAWGLVPLQSEGVGDADGWLRERFGTAWARVRDTIRATGHIAIGRERVPLSATAYEAESLIGLLTPKDLEALYRGHRALPDRVRDEAGRWRAALDELDVAAKFGTTELLDGFTRGLFAGKDASWWVDAAVCLTENHPAKDEILGVSCWLTDELRPAKAQPKGETARPARRWRFSVRIPPRVGISWIGSITPTAAPRANPQSDGSANTPPYTRQVDAATELDAFAERFAQEPLPISDEALRAIRDRFDEVPDQDAEEIGRRVGAALLLDGHVYHDGKRHRRKVSPTNAYLSRTIDGDHPDWPTAAGTTPDIQWVAARYAEQLKTGATRRSRRRTDGTISRGPRKLLMLLGAECTPRLVSTGPVRGGHPVRVKELQSLGAEEVTHDFLSPDLAKILAALKQLKPKEAKTKSPALFRTLSRNWKRVYSHRTEAPSVHHARIYTYPRGSVTSDWLIHLREEPWIAVRGGRLVPPSSAVIKTHDTRSLYPSNAFAASLDPKHVDPEFAKALGLITHARLTDLVDHLAQIRDGGKAADDVEVLQVYRNIAKTCPTSVSWNTRIGDMTVQQLRARFSEGAGLIHIGDGVWRCPAELRRGSNVLHDPARFAPGGSPCNKLWSVLGVEEPSLNDCIATCNDLASEPFATGTVAILIDVYRYMETLLASASRSQKRRLKRLPLLCSRSWERGRPIYFVTVPELGAALAGALPGCNFWTPPCDLRDLPKLVDFAAVIKLQPKLRVGDDTVRARERGDAFRPRFVQAVEHLSDVLARNDPTTRQKIALNCNWDKLKAIPLFIYEQPFAVNAKDDALSAKSIHIVQQALFTDQHAEFHVTLDGLPKREFGGRAIGSLFPVHLSRNIEAEWCVSWLESLDVRSDPIRLASDEDLKQTLEEQANKINNAPKRKIRVSSPRTRTPGTKLRTLKESVGVPGSAEVIPGGPPKPAMVRRRQRMTQTPPLPSEPSSTPSSSFVAYTNAELEQRGWEILEQVLNTAENEQLVDFRRRHGVGADGVINWKTFVEMKATGRSPQSSVEMSNSEYERAKERGQDFILALVSGLEVGQPDEVRLIFDPASRATTRPVNGVRLVGLLDTPAVIVPFEQAPSVD